MENREPIKLYTDGACSRNPGPGGYGMILTWKQHRKEMSEGYRKTTNNRMELLAVIAGLEAIKEPGYEVIIYSDSKYVVDSVEKGWLWNWEKNHFKDKKNEDLWRRFIITYRKHKVKFIWLKGHAGHPENERCDRLAVAAYKGDHLKTDFGFESELRNG
ncbi:MAG: ribonuclease HI [Cytophagaceae bacterium]|jgi:ribonuclease HI|nr:ribonuclease HI [Cytophagaceae bacterium]